MASDSDVVENNPISKSLRTKREKLCNVYIKRKEMILNKLSGTCNFYCVNINGFKSKADSIFINRIMLELIMLMLCYCVKLKHTLFFTRNSLLRNLYWDNQIAKKLSVFKPQRL